MSNIDKQAVTAKTKELASFMVERFSMNPVSCKLLNEAWEKEFPDEVAIAERMLALLDELEAETRYREGAFIACNRWHDKFREADDKLEAAERLIAELDQRLIEYAGIATREARRVAELEARKVNLSKLSVGEVMHMSGFSRDYAEGWCAGNDNAIHEIRTAGLKVKES